MTESDLGMSSSISEMSSGSEDSAEENYGNFNLDAPYHGEPLANVDDANQEDINIEEDPDGIALQILESRFERRLPVNQW